MTPKTLEELRAMARDSDAPLVAVAKYIDGLKAEIERLKAKRVEDMQAAWDAGSDDECQNPNQPFSLWLAEYDKEKE